MAIKKEEIISKHQTEFKSPVLSVIQGGKSKEGLSREFSTIIENAQKRIFGRFERSQYCYQNPQGKRYDSFYLDSQDIIEEFENFLAGDTSKASGEERQKIDQVIDMEWIGIYPVGPYSKQKRLEALALLSRTCDIRLDTAKQDYLTGKNNFSKNSTLEYILGLKLSCDYEVNQGRFDLIRKESNGKKV